MIVHRKVYRPKHPKASASGEIYAHVEVAERVLGRQLPDGVEIHHVDGNPRNNAPINLVICQDKAYHKLLHIRERIVSAGGNPDTQKLCSLCRRVLDLNRFNRMKSNKAYGRQTACRSCQKERFKQWAAETLDVVIPDPAEVSN